MKNREASTFHYFNVAIYENRAEVLSKWEQRWDTAPTFLVYIKRLRKKEGEIA